MAISPSLSNLLITDPRGGNHPWIHRWWKMFCQSSWEKCRNMWPVTVSNWYLLWLPIISQELVNRFKGESTLIKCWFGEPMRMRLASHERCVGMRCYAQVEMYPLLKAPNVSESSRQGRHFPTVDALWWFVLKSIRKHVWIMLLWHQSLQHIFSDSSLLCLYYSWFLQTYFCHWHQSQ